MLLGLACSIALPLEQLGRGYVSSLATHGGDTILCLQVQI